MSSKIVLWGSPTFRSGRVQWMLEELGLSYELKPIQPRNGDTQKVRELVQYLFVPTLALISPPACAQ